MTTLKNVVLAGASGNVGTVVLAALVSSGKFNVTVFSRAGSKSTFPEGTKVVEVDYNSLDSLTSALTGQDAVVSTFASEALGGQNTLIDAAAAAGVKRFLPSEFGSNLDNPKARQLPVFGFKVQTQEYLIAKAKETGITYTFVYNSAFLDWGLTYDFILKTSDSKPNLVNGGDLEFSATALGTVGEGVVGVLTHPEETKNRAVYLSDIIVTQNKLLAIAKKVAPNRPWETQVLNLDEMTAAADERLKKQLFDVETFFPYLFRAIFDPAYGGKFEKTDMELLGLKGKTEEDIEGYFKVLLK